MPEISRTFQMVNGEAVPLPSGGGPDPGIAARVKALENRFDPEGRPIALSLATATAPGIVRVGHGLSITEAISQGDGEEAGAEAGGDEDSQGTETPGVLSLGSHASADPARYGKGDSLYYGHVRIVDNFEEALTSADGVAISPNGVKKAWDRLFGVVDSKVFTTSSSWAVPETGQYTVTCVGGGGSGGSGGAGKARNDYTEWNGGSGCASYSPAGGGGGGGGGAGQVVTRKLSLTKGTVISFTVGGPGGNTIFSSITALGGGAGGAGGDGIVPCSGNNATGGAAGAPGVSYGSTPTAGSAGGTYQGTGPTNGIYQHGCSGGGGGLGGVTVHSPYGDGGNGGVGASVPRQSPGSVNFTAYGTAGAAGNQGCIIIESPIAA